MWTAIQILVLAHRPCDSNLAEQAKEQAERVGPGTRRMHGTGEAVAPGISRSRPVNVVVASDASTQHAAELRMSRTGFRGDL